MYERSLAHDEAAGWAGSGPGRALLAEVKRCAFILSHAGCCGILTKVRLDVICILQKSFRLLLEETEGTRVCAGKLIGYCRHPSKR